MQSITHEREPAIEELYKDIHQHRHQDKKKCYWVGKKLVQIFVNSYSLRCLFLFDIYMWNVVWLSFIRSYFYYSMLPFICRRSAQGGGQSTETRSRRRRTTSNSLPLLEQDFWVPSNLNNKVPVNGFGAKGLLWSNKLDDPCQLVPSPSTIMTLKKWLHGLIRLFLRRPKKLEKRKCVRKLRRK